MQLFWLRRRSFVQQCIYVHPSHSVGTAHIRGRSSPLKRKKAMKLHLVKILLVLIIGGCITNKEKIKKTWIGKYEIQNTGTENERIMHSGIRRILKFDDKKLITKNFHFDFLTDDNNEVSKSFQIVENQIILKEDTLSIKDISNDSLVFFSNSEYPSKVVYEKLPNHNQVKREKDFFDFITSNSFLIQEDTVKIEFSPNGKYVSDNFKVGVGSNQFWMIDKFENELFLVLDGFWGAVFHIERFDSKRIVSKIYWKENKEIIFNKIDKETGFNISEIIGEWEQQGNLIPPPPVENEEEFYNDETLKISESEIIKFEGFQRDTFTWELNRGKDIIILEGNKNIWNPKQWNILSIEDDILTLKRKRRFKNLSGNIIETMKFKRKK
jgi:hypothetical protein